MRRVAGELDGSRSIVRRVESRLRPSSLEIWERLFLPSSEWVVSRPRQVVGSFGPRRSFRIRRRPMLGNGGARTTTERTWEVESLTGRCWTRNRGSDAEEEKGPVVYRIPAATHVTAQTSAIRRSLELPRRSNPRRHLFSARRLRTRRWQFAGIGVVCDQNHPDSSRSLLSSINSPISVPL